MKRKTLHLPFYPWVLKALLLDFCLCDAYDVCDEVGGVVCGGAYGVAYGVAGGVAGDEDLALEHT